MEGTPLFADLIIYGGQVCTLAGPEAPRRGPEQAALGVIDDGIIAVRDGRIVEVWAGGDATAYLGPATAVIEARDAVITPGLVDAHTHLVFAGDRAAEYELRLAGAGYLEIMAAGGGIMSTVRATRGAGEAELAALLRQRLARMLAHGTTAVEIKSGYGLSTEAELKSLRAVRRVRDALAEGGAGPRIAPTFLGAHAVPAEYAGRADDYVRLLVEETLPAVVAEGLAESCDVFCDEGAFTAAQARAILEAARGLGLPVRLHANEFARIGAAELAAELHALSADHVLLLSPAEIAMLAAAGVVAVLLPGTGLGLGHAAPARALIAAGVPVAVATDCNPGTCYCESLPLMLALACTTLRLQPAEALVAATLNAAWALGPRWAAQIGSLEPGKWADLVIWDAPDYRHLPYHFGVNLVRQVLVGGRVMRNA